MNADEAAFPKHAIELRAPLYSWNGTPAGRNQIKQWRRLWLVTVGLTSISLSNVDALGPNKDHCLAREGKTSIVGADDTARYESKLFVTKDDVARYVFLTNANDDGDRSVAVYREPGKRGSLPEAYWVTSTEAPTSLTDGDSATAKKKPHIKRADAPIPEAAARKVHALWLAILKASPVDEKAIPLAPTAIISATTANGVRLKAVTVAVGDDPHCIAFSVALMRFGQTLINYPQLPESQRVEAARRIEKESQQLLKRATERR